MIEIHKEKEQGLYPMLPTDEPERVKPSCSAMVSLLEEKSKRVISEWSETLEQLETKKSEADQIKLGIIHSAFNI